MQQKIMNAMVSSSSRWSSGCSMSISFVRGPPEGAVDGSACYGVVAGVNHARAALLVTHKPLLLRESPRDIVGAGDLSPTQPVKVSLDDGLSLREAPGVVCEDFALDGG